MQMFNSIKKKVLNSNIIKLIIPDFSLSILFELHKKIKGVDMTDKEICLIVNLDPTNKNLCASDISYIKNISQSELNILVEYLSTGKISVRNSFKLIDEYYIINDCSVKKYNVNKNKWLCISSSYPNRIHEYSNDISNHLYSFIKSISKLMIGIGEFINTDNVFAKQIKIMDLTKGDKRKSKIRFLVHGNLNKYNVRIKEYNKNKCMTSQKTVVDSSEYLSTIIMVYGTSTLREVLEQKVFITIESFPLKKKGTRRLTGRNHTRCNQVLDEGHKENYEKNVILRDEKKQFYKGTI